MRASMSASPIGRMPCSADGSPERSLEPKRAKGTTVPEVT